MVCGGRGVSELGPLLVTLLGENGNMCRVPRVTLASSNC